MSNKASNQVHELIRSLSPAEKRYFKLYAERHSADDKNGYLRLFQAIGRQEDYEESTILEEFSNESFIKHFSIAKNRLYHQILKSLDAYHSESSVDAELNRYLHYVEILFQKTLYRQCSRVLSSASKIAIKHEKFPILIQILDWEKKLIEVRSHEESPTLSYDPDKIIQILSRQSKIWDLKSQFFALLFRTGQARSEESAKESLELLEELLKFRNEANDFESNYLINHTESAIHYHTGDYESCLAALILNYELVGEHLEIVRGRPILYHSLLTNLIFVSSKVKDFANSRRFLEESRNLPSKLKIKSTEYIEYRIFTDSYGLELAICNHTGNRERGKILLEILPEKILEWSMMMGEAKRASFYHGLSVLAFTLGDSKEALRWNNELLNTTSIRKAEDSYCFGQIFHAVLHFELEHYELLPNILKSLERYLETRDRKYKFEQHFIELMKRLSTSEKINYSLVFETFKAKIDLLREKDYEKIVFDYFDFSAWAESHIKAKPLEEILSNQLESVKLF